MPAFVTILIIFVVGIILPTLLAGIAIYTRLVRLRTTVKSSL